MKIVIPVSPTMRKVLVPRQRATIKILPPSPKSEAERLAELRSLRRPHDRRAFQVCVVEDKSRTRGGLEVGGPDGSRTRDLMNAIHARSQLRYWPTSCARQCLSDLSF
jgi:hypothetical protein